MKTWNVMVAAYKLVDAETAGDAVADMTSQLQAAGFQVDEIIPADVIAWNERKDDDA
jgi:hypothetical protein